MVKSADCNVQHGVLFINILMLMYELVLQNEKNHIKFCMIHSSPLLWAARGIAAAGASL